MGSIPERGCDMRDMWLRDPYAEDLEPALESCVKYANVVDESTA